MIALLKRRWQLLLIVALGLALAGTVLFFTVFQRAPQAPSQDGRLRLMLDHAFRFAREVRFEVGCDNVRSRRAMEKIGAELLGERPEPLGSTAAPHVLYRMRAPG